MNKTRRITVYARQRNLPVPLSDLYEPLEFSLWNVGHKISRAQYRRWIKKSATRCAAVTHHSSSDSTHRSGLRATLQGCYGASLSSIEAAGVAQGDCGVESDDHGI